MLKKIVSVCLLGLAFATGAQAVQPPTDADFKRAFAQFQDGNKTAANIVGPVLRKMGPDHAETPNFLEMQLWTALNPKTPRNAMELWAQTLRFHFGASVISKMYDKARLMKDINFLVIQHPQAHGDVTGQFERNISLDVSHVQEMMWLPRSSELAKKACDFIALEQSGRARYSYADLFAMWGQNRDAKAFLTYEGMLKYYHPSLARMSESVSGTEEYLGKYKEWQAYQAQFQKDPMNRARNLSPVGFEEFVANSRFRSYSVYNLPAREAFLKKFGQKTINAIEEAVWNYAIGKTNELILPAEVSNYLNS